MKSRTDTSSRLVDAIEELAAHKRELLFSNKIINKKLEEREIIDAEILKHFLNIEAYLKSLERRLDALEEQRLD